MDAKPKWSKSHRLAFILSGLVPGFGQFYNEDWLKGIGFFVGGIFLSNIALADLSFDAIVAGKIEAPFSLLLRLIGLSLFWVWCIFDADRSARRKNALLSTPPH